MYCTCRILGGQAPNVEPLRVHWPPAPLYQNRTHKRMQGTGVYVCRMYHNYTWYKQ